jgi:aminopeptidase-like protein
VPTGTAVFDCVIQREWNISEACIWSERDEKVHHFAQSNLHVMSYSLPAQQRISPTQLKQHVYTLPDQPDGGQRPAQLLQHNGLLTICDDANPTMI